MENVYLEKPDYIAPPTDEYIAPPVETENTYSGKNRYVAGILAILLGTFGVHNFYFGYTKKALIQLIFGFSVVLSFVSTVWGISEGVLLFKEKINIDGNGKMIL